MDRGWVARHAPAVAFAAYVLVASVVDPASAGAGGLSGTVLGVGLDKWLHLGTYAGLAGLLGFARDARTVRALVAVAVVAAGYGMGIEVVQAFLPARAFDLADAAANAIGAVLGSAGWRAARAPVRRLAGRLT